MILQKLIIIIPNFSIETHENKKCKLSEHFSLHHLKLIIGIYRLIVYNFRRVMKLKKMIKY